MTTETKTVTEREAVEREREAFIAGMASQYVRSVDGETWTCKDPAENRDRIRHERAAKYYPLPKLTRPREKHEPENASRLWRVVDGQIETRVIGAADRNRAQWHRTDTYMQAGASVPVTPARVAIWADLLATPDEEYEP